MLGWGHVYRRRRHVQRPWRVYRGHAARLRRVPIVRFADRVHRPRVHADADAYAYQHADGDADRDADGNTDVHPDSHFHVDTNRDADCDRNADTYAGQLCRRLRR